MYSILFVDDEKNVLTFLKDLFEDDYEVFTTNNGYKAINIIDKKEPDIVFLDIMMPDIDGIETLKLIKQRYPNQLIIMLTAVNDVQTAVNAIKMGAYDYINKPFEITDIRKTVKKAIDYLELKYNNEYFAQKTNPNYQKIDFIGNNAEIKNIHEVIKKIATKDVTVLIQGETGSGKEVVAKLIHKYSKRNNENFISVDCSAIPSTLIESELFGYEKGAFTGAVNKKIGRFELADNGTLFLDEIGNIPIEFQPKLLRAIQENEIFRLGGEKAIKINTRLIVATHVNLEESIYNQKFREDLYFRINVIRINLPPLRERLDDIPLLLDYFLEKCCKKFGINKLNYDNNVIAYLQSYNWPGNIREFQNAVERAIVLTGSLNKLQVKNFNLSNSSVNEANTFFKNFVNKKRTLKEAQQNFESNYISEILKKYNGSRKLASEHLKIDRSYMSKLITKYNIKI